MEQSQSYRIVPRVTLGKANSATRSTELVMFAPPGKMPGDPTLALLVAVPQVCELAPSRDIDPGAEPALRTSAQLSRDILHWLSVSVSFIDEVVSMTMATLYGLVIAPAIAAVAVAVKVRVFLPKIGAKNRLTTICSCT